MLWVRHNSEKTEAIRRSGSIWRAGGAALASVGALLAVAAFNPATAGASPTHPAATSPARSVHAASATPQPLVGNPYWMASADGAVWPLGGAPTLGSPMAQRLSAPVVGISATGGGGYNLVAADGGVFSYGDAHFYGSTGGMKLNKPVIGLTPTPGGQGYWMYAADGGVFSFGDARFYGSTGGIRLNKPVVGMAATPDGKGYWLFGADGGTFSFGDARFYGSTGAIRLSAPIVSMASTPDAGGYWLMASDGGVFAFGDARFAGSLAGTGQVAAMIIADRNGGGYWAVTHDAAVYPFGAAASDRVPAFGLLHTILTPGDKAMEWAMTQLGKPYLWGGTGPNAYDCSGLVMQAWASVGVTIPRVAADQYAAGPMVPISNLRIGDLVYWADNTSQPSTVHHVAMYIGGDHMVNAPYTGQVVSTDWIGGSGFMSLGTAP